MKKHITSDSNHIAVLTTQNADAVHNMHGGNIHVHMFHRSLIILPSNPHKCGIFNVGNKVQRIQIYNLLLPGIHDQYEE